MIKTRILSAITAAALVAAGSVPAFAKAQDSQSYGRTSASSSDKAERKICKSFPNTASRLRTETLCLTKSGWKKFDAQQ